MIGGTWSYRNREHFLGRACSADSRHGAQMSIGPTEGARDLLAAERASAQARLAALEREFDGIVESSAAAAADDEHDPEGGTTAFERQHLAALIGQARTGWPTSPRRSTDWMRVATASASSAGAPSPPSASRPAATTCISCAAAS